MGAHSRLWTPPGEYWNKYSAAQRLVDPTAGVSSRFHNLRGVRPQGVCPPRLPPVRKTA